jgi:hypothetical protein
MRWHDKAFGKLWIEMHDGSLMQGDVIEMTIEHRTAANPGSTIFGGQHITMPRIIEFQGKLNNLYSIGVEGMKPPFPEFSAVNRMYENNSVWLWKFLGYKVKPKKLVV